MKQILASAVEVGDLVFDNKGKCRGVVHRTVSVYRGFVTIELRQGGEIVRCSGRNTDVVWVQQPLLPGTVGRMSDVYLRDVVRGQVLLCSNNGYLGVIQTVTTENGQTRVEYKGKDGRIRMAGAFSQELVTVLS